jgi:hypothetical protein
MEGRRVSLTPRATMRFGSLSFVYIGPAEPILGRTFAWPARPNVLTGAEGTRGVRPRLLERDDRGHVVAKPNAGAF